ncbi:hypothetical protein HDU91_000553, partial [Kappamyces sp. JEL0680]
MSDLNSYLMAKMMKQKGSLEPLEAKQDFSHEMADFKHSARSPTPVRRAERAEQEVDYSPGSNYWNVPTLTQPEHPATPSTVPKPRLDTSRLSAKGAAELNTASVAQLLKQMKHSEETPPDALLKQKSSSLNTLVEAGIQDIAANSIRERLDELQSQIDCKVAYLEGIFRKEMEQLTQLQKEEMHELRLCQSIPEAKQPSDAISLESFKQILAQSQDSWSSLSSRDKPEGPLDRPTRALLSSINDKIIVLSKSQEHEFNSFQQRLSQLEKKLSKPAASSIDQQESNAFIKTVLHSLEARIGKGEREWHADFEKLEKLVKLALRENRRGSQAELSADEPVTAAEILGELKSMRKSCDMDQNTAQERMSQFLHMFSLLQDAHGELLQQVRAQASLQEQLVQKINRMEASQSDLLESVSNQICDVAKS